MFNEDGLSSPGLQSHWDPRKNLEMPFGEGDSRICFEQFQQFPSTTAFSTTLCLELTKYYPLIPPKAAGAAHILVFHPSLGLWLQLGLQPHARILLAMQSLHQMAPGGTCHLFLLLPDGWVTAQPASRLSPEAPESLQDPPKDSDATKFASCKRKRQKKLEV